MNRKTRKRNKRKKHSQESADTLSGEYYDALSISLDPNSQDSIPGPSEIPVSSNEASQEEYSTPIGSNSTEDLNAFIECETKESKDTSNKVDISQDLNAAINEKLMETPMQIPTIVNYHSTVINITTTGDAQNQSISGEPPARDERNEHRQESAWGNTNETSNNHAPWASINGYVQMSPHHFQWPRMRNPGGHVTFPPQPAGWPPIPGHRFPSIQPTQPWLPVRGYVQVSAQSQGSMETAVSNQLQPTSWLQMRGYVQQSQQATRYPVKKHFSDTSYTSSRTYSRGHKTDAPENVKQIQSANTYTTIESTTFYCTTTHTASSSTMPAVIPTVVPAKKSNVKVSAVQAQPSTKVSAVQAQLPTTKVVSVNNSTNTYNKKCKPTDAASHKNQSAASSTIAPPVQMPKLAPRWSTIREQNKAYRLACTQNTENKVIEPPKWTTIKGQIQESRKTRRVSYIKRRDIKDIKKPATTESISESSPISVQNLEETSVHEPELLKPSTSQTINNEVNISRNELNLTGMNALRLNYQKYVAARNRQLQQAILQQTIHQQIISRLIIPQQIIPQQIFPQQIIPQQIIPQQIIPQQIIPQQIIPQQIIPQQFILMIPQQIIPQPIIIQKTMPQHIIPHPIFIQKLIPQQIIPQQIIPQKIIPQQIIPQQIIPQQIIIQKIFPPKFVLQQMPYVNGHITETSVAAPVTTRSIQNMPAHEIGQIYTYSNSNTQENTVASNWAFQPSNWICLGTQNKNPSSVPNSSSNSQNPINPDHKTPSTTIESIWDTEIPSFSVFNNFTQPPSVYLDRYFDSSQPMTWPIIGNTETPNLTSTQSTAMNSQVVTNSQINKNTVQTHNADQAQNQPRKPWWVSTTKPAQTTTNTTPATTSQQVNCNRKTSKQQEKDTEQNELLQWVIDDYYPISFTKEPYLFYKKKPCKNYHGHGLCYYGQRCHFIHDEYKAELFNRAVAKEIRRRIDAGLMPSNTPTTSSNVKEDAIYQNSIDEDYDAGSRLAPYERHNRNANQQNDCKRGRPSTLTFGDFL